MILLGDEEQEISCYDKIIRACNCCSGKCSNNDPPVEDIELPEIIHPNQQTVPLEEPDLLLLNGSGSLQEVADVDLVHENPSIVKGNETQNVNYM